MQEQRVEINLDIDIKTEYRWYTTRKRLSTEGYEPNYNLSNPQFVRGILEGNLCIRFTHIFFNHFIMDNVDVVFTLGVRV